MDFTHYSNEEAQMLGMNLIQTQRTDILQYQKLTDNASRTTQNGHFKISKTTRTDTAHYNLKEMKPLHCQKLT